MLDGFILCKIITDISEKPVDYLCLEVNNAFESLTGLKKEETIGYRVSEIIPNIRDSKPNLFEIFGKVALTGENTKFEIFFEPLKIWFLTSIYSPKKGYFVAVFDNITERKQAEKDLRESEVKLKKLNEELEKKVEERTRKIKKSEEKYREAYEIADFYKDLFAHDINNILHNVLASSNLCLMYLNDPENQNKIKEMLNIHNDQIKRGIRLISNVYTLSELEKSKISTESTMACESLRKSIESVKKVFQDRNINIHINSIDKKIFVQANNLIDDVFENILDNAVKYNDKSSVEIFVEISKERTEGINYFKFEFKDNGIGVADDRKKKIFKKELKKAKGVKGMGFGLSLVTKIIESYDGQIWVEDRVKGERTHGSNFIFLIPEA